MPIVVFYETLAKYKALPHSLVFMFCKQCSQETPQTLNSCDGGFSALCNACCDLQKFGRFVRHDYCKVFVEAFGFIATAKTKVLILKNFYEKSGACIEILVPVVTWSADPINHNKICVPPITVPP